MYPHLPNTHMVPGKKPQRILQYLEFIFFNILSQWLTDCIEDRDEGELSIFVQALFMRLKSKGLCSSSITERCCSRQIVDSIKKVVPWWFFCRTCYGSIHDLVYPQVKMFGNVALLDTLPS